MNFLKQLCVVLWKNWVLQKRRVCVSVFEILLPVAFIVLLLFIRSQIGTQVVEEATDYDDVDISQLSNNLQEWLVGYAPKTLATDNVMARAEALMQSHTSFINFNVTFRAFNSEEEAEEYRGHETYKDSAVIVVFSDVDNNSSSALPPNTRFAIRPSTFYNGEWMTRWTFPFFQRNKPRHMFHMPYYEPIVYLQRLVGEALIHYRMDENGQDSSSVHLGVYSKRLPYPPYLINHMNDVLKIFLPLFLILSFLICVVINTKTLVYEKERKIKESMKLMGLRPSVYWISWLITFLVYLLPAIILYAVLSCADITSNGPILSYSNGFLFFIFLFIYSLSLITFCFMVSTFVQKANVASAVSGILFIVFYCPYWWIDPRYQNLIRSQKLGLCLSFNLAMGLGANVISIYEGTGEGAQFNNFHKPATVDDNLSLLDCMIMMLVDSGIHLLITWYLDNVRPGEFGVPKPWYFPCMKSYWLPIQEKSAASHDVPESRASQFEKDPSAMNAGITINNLRKVFDHNVAVDGMSLNLYEGQITVLLGHNGAGKTTTMSMLTGFIPVTSGSAVVNGYDIRDNIDGVRSSLGLCPQHDILFDTMTVYEHLYFFAKLKGSPNDSINCEIQDLATELGIKTKLNDRSMTLSGGQKRKLSVAIALIGGSKIVILDEPSSGMDPAARRQTWTVLEKHREGRTMLLTTHYMDEADVLGDRIAIMAEGIVKCCGSSMFLKKLYGAGYHLVVVKEPQCDVDALTEVIQTNVPTSSLEGIINTEVTYLLPDNESASFPALFDNLDAKKASLGISSFGASATTMEEVFLKVGESGLIEDESPDQESSTVIGHENPKLSDEKETLLEETVKETSDETKKTGGAAEMGAETDFMVFNKGFTKKTGLSLELAKIKGLFVKKALLTWRKRVITFSQLVLPLISIIIILEIQRRSSETSIEEEDLNLPLKFDLSPFGKTYIPYTPGSQPQQQELDLAEYYARQFKGQTLESFNVTDYGKYDEYALKRAKELGTVTFNRKVIIGLEGKVPAKQESLAAIAHFNGQPYHAQPIAMNMMMNAFLQYYTEGKYSLETSINPLPQTMSEDIERRERDDKYVQAILMAMSMGIFLVFGMSFLTALFIYYPIKEKQVGAKHLQIVTGVSPISYWISSILWDFITYIVPNLLIIIIFAAYSKDAYVNDGRWLIVILILIIYGWAVLPFTYALSFLFKEPPSGVASTIFLSLVTGVISLITVTILHIPGLDTNEEADIVDWICIVLFPNYNMAQSFVSMYVNHFALDFCKVDRLSCPNVRSPCCRADYCGASIFCMRFEDNYLSLDKPGIGLYLLFMIFHGFFYSGIIMLIEYNVFLKLWYLIKPPSDENPNQETFEQSASQSDDGDVATEKERLVSSTPSVLSDTDPLLLVNLYKRYGNTVVVDHISLGVPEQECFGLLGQNGAGKTTTFKMLTGDVMVTGGNAYLKGFDVRNNITKVQANMGYCPQFDALLDQMTGRETLTMYSRLRGIPESNIKGVVDNLMDCLMLTPHADKLTEKYSGGNKRKLSTAIALAGDPPFIMLDEPTAGVDPKARRKVWTVLSRVRESGRTLVLTSHSMEECDALCTRIAIMVNGRFMCLGSPQHLKNKFGQGYTLIAKLGLQEDGEPTVNEPVINFVCEHLPGTKVFGNHQGYVHFQVPEADASLSKIFSLMEKAKEDLSVSDYSVHQTTLEQVFLAFTRDQNPPKVQVKHGACKNVFCCCCLACGVMK